MLALFIGSAFFACVGDVGETLLTGQANRLLNSDFFKVWTRIERWENGSQIDIGSCDDNQEWLFGNLEGNIDSLLVSNRAFDCGDLDSVLVLMANYEVSGNVDDEFINEIIVYKEDTSIYEILDLTSRYLRIRYEEEETEIEEVFTFDFE